MEFDDKETWANFGVWPNETGPNPWGIGCDGCDKKYRKGAIMTTLRFADVDFTLCKPCVELGLVTLADAKNRMRRGPAPTNG
jgi:hypothetical protein